MWLRTGAGETCVRSTNQRIFDMSATNVPMTMDQALAHLEGMKTAHVDMASRMLRAYGAKAYAADLLCLASLKRSMSLIDGFILLIKANNFICAASLVRLQLDTLLRTRAMWLAQNPHDFATNVMAGEPINKMVDRDGNKMSDRYLVASMKTECPWIEKVYEETCGYIHFSSKHYFNVLRTDGMPDGPIKMAVSAEDTCITDRHRFEAVMAVIDITENLFRYVDGWIFTKANPEVVRAMREQRSAGGSTSTA